EAAARPDPARHTELRRAAFPVQRNAPDGGRRRDAPEVGPDHEARVRRIVAARQVRRLARVQPGAGTPAEALEPTGDVGTRDDTTTVPVDPIETLGADAVRAQRSGEPLLEEVAVRAHGAVVLPCVVRGGSAARRRELAVVLDA